MQNTRHVLLFHRRDHIDGKAMSKTDIVTSSEIRIECKVKLPRKKSIT